MQIGLIGSIALSIYLVELIILAVLIGWIFICLIRFKSIKKDLLYFIYVAVAAFISLIFGMYFSLVENVSKIVGWIGLFFEGGVLILFILLFIRLWEKINLKLVVFAIGLFVVNMILTIFKTLNKSDILILIINVLTFFVLMIFYFIVINFVIDNGDNK